MSLRDAVQTVQIVVLARARCGVTTAVKAVSLSAGRASIKYQINRPDRAQIYGPLRFFRTKFGHGALKFSESDDPMGSSTSTSVECEFDEVCNGLSQLSLQPLRMCSAPHVWAYALCVENPRHAHVAGRWARGWGWCRSREGV
uniref:Uncharacterized protein n=1 Tax=Oryza punctata TaxID=4537 RepID=A0A0E0JWG0_ORYPU